MTTTELITITEACEIAHCHHMKLYRAIKAGELHIASRTGRHAWLRRDELSRWMAGRNRAAPGVVPASHRVVNRPIVELTKAEMHRELRQAVINTGGRL